MRIRLKYLSQSIILGQEKEAKVNSRNIRKLIDNHYMVIIIFDTLYGNYYYLGRVLEKYGPLQE